MQVLWVLWVLVAPPALQVPLWILFMIGDIGVTGATGVTIYKGDAWNTSGEEIALMGRVSDARALCAAYSC